MQNGGDSIEMGYGAIEYKPRTGICCPEADGKNLVLKASLSVMIALFSTALTDNFGRQYEIVENSQGVSASSSTPCFSWMAKIFELAEIIQSETKPALPCSGEMSSVVKDAVLKSAVAISTMFDSRDGKISRFMKKMTRRYNDKHAKRADFYTMVVMLALCLFPYLKHRVLGKLFNNRTLVIMCFDKTRTRHRQWSTISTQIHLHVKQPEFVQRVLSKPAVGSSLPVVDTVTLDTYISTASYSKNENTSRRRAPRDQLEHPEPCAVAHQTDTTGPHSSLHREKTTRSIVGKRRTPPCSTGQCETLDGKAACLQRS